MGARYNLRVAYSAEPVFADGLTLICPNRYRDFIGRDAQVRVVLHELALPGGIHILRTFL